MFHIDLFDLLTYSLVVRCKDCAESPRRTTIVDMPARHIPAKARCKHALMGNLPRLSAGGFDWRRVGEGNRSVDRGSRPIGKRNGNEKAGLRTRLLRLNALQAPPLRHA